LGGGPPGFTQGFSYPVLLGCSTTKLSGISRTRLSRSLAARSQGPSAIPSFSLLRPTAAAADAESHDPPEATPAGLTLQRFRLFPVRSPLLRESLLLSLPPGTEMVHFPGFASPALCVQAGNHTVSRCGVPPFGNPRITGCVLLPAAYRSLPRPSSPTRA
jgi:hypothetical protein